MQFTRVGGGGVGGSLSIASEVIGAAAALAGLILVFLGSISTSFDSYKKEEQKSVRSRYKRRAWFAFIGFTLALLSVLAGLIGKSLNNEYAALASAALLMVALIWALLAALFAVLEIR